MVKFGMCGGVDKAAATKAAGYDYLEGNVQALFQGVKEDAAWDGQALVKSAGIPIPSANVLVPGDLKITGPTADLEKLRAYMTRVLTRAGACGTKTLVFGSGGARNVPEGFSREEARKQILAFIRMFAPIAQANGVTVVAEPLNKGECNILNSVEEAMTYVKEVNHPSFQCLVDSYHFWLEREPLKNLEAAMPWIKHVHVADEQGRVAPGQSGNSDYRPFFRVLKAANYDGMISVEGNVTPEVYKTALEYLKKEWAAA
jgi:sugar phosphate isomerase/epimerase